MRQERSWVKRHMVSERSDGKWVTQKGHWAAPIVVHDTREEAVAYAELSPNESFQNGRFLHPDHPLYNQPLQAAFPEE